MLKNPYSFAALIVVAATLLFARQIADHHEDDALARLEQGDALKVGYSIDAPFAFLMPDGEVGGEAPEVFRHVLNDLGYRRLEWLHTDFGSLLHELASGRIDAIAAGMFISPARAREFRFTRPTALVRAGLLVLAGNPKALHSFGDIAASRDSHVAVVDGALERGLALAAGVPAGRVATFPDPVSALSALVRGTVDGVALSAVSLRHLLASHAVAGVELAEPFEVPEDGAGVGRPAFVFRKSDEPLAARVDQALDRFLGSETHRSLVQRFGFGVGDLPAAIGDLAESRQ